MRWELYSQPPPIEQGLKQVCTSLTHPHRSGHLFSRFPKIWVSFFEWHLESSLRHGHDLETQIYFNIIIIEKSVFIHNTISFQHDILINEETHFTKTKICASLWKPAISQLKQLSKFCSITKIIFFKSNPEINRE